MQRKKLYNEKRRAGLTAEEKERIAKEQNEDVLSAWLKLAARADSIEEFQSKM